MFVLYRSKIVGVGLSLVVGLAAGGATPNFAQAALSPEAKCREAVARATRKAASLTVNARAKCIKQRLKFKIGAGVDCMADPPGLGGPGTGDDKTDAQLLKLAKYRDSQVKRIPRSCSGIDLGALGVADVCVPSSTNAAEVAECAVMELGKPAGDSLTQLINVPQPVVPTKSLARKCYEIINRGIRQNERKLNLLRGDCFETAEELGQSSANCLATIAPPGIVDTTGFAEIDEKLIKRPLKFRGRVWTFCQDIDFDSIGFDAILPDYTPPPFTLDDAFGVLYDGLLHEVTIINSIIFPPLSYCGDSNVDPGEECDDGDRLSCDGCDRDCSIPACGNGASCDLELCDDGNPFNGDGCDTSCVSEVCGNGVLQAGIGEECDDGVANSDVLPDACRTDCREPYCGDHIVDTGEACDPPDGDQCEPNCTSPNCGDGIVDPGEECDDGVANSDVAPDACRSDCSDPSCGDNVVDSTEQCDPPDGGVTCKVDCTFVTCGNGIFEPGFGEECDDGAGNSDSAPDACRTDCRLPSCGDGVSDSGEVCDTAGNSAFCDADCTSASCGDGFANGAAGEQCDDANPVEGDGCDSNCTFTACGNGIPTGGELCDDGNTTPGDLRQPRSSVSGQGGFGPVCGHNRNLLCERRRL
jgi:cysteine-rich repeat protein